MNATEAKHTEGTWTVSPIISNKNEGEARKYHAVISAHYKGDKQYVCDLDFGYGQKADEANAAYIVQACNSHEKLMHELKRCVKYLRLPVEKRDGGSCEIASAELMIEQAEQEGI